MKKLILLCMILSACHKESKKGATTYPAQPTAPVTIYNYTVNLNILTDTIPIGQIKQQGKVTLKTNGNTLLVQQVPQGISYTFTISTKDSLTLIYNPGLEYCTCTHTVGNTTVIDSDQPRKAYASLSFAGGPQPVGEFEYKQRGTWDLFTKIYN